MRIIGCGILAWFVAWGAPAAAQERAFQFGLMGDLPYSKLEEKEFANLITMLNATELAFVVHVGDMQVDARAYMRNPAPATAPCNDAYDAWFLDMIGRIRHPVVVTPGDNDWTDCHAIANVDPLARLAKLRAAFYPDGRSLGQRTIAVESQAKDPQFTKFKENLRWSIGGVTFATIHTVGSEDNSGRTPEMDAEHRERKAANIAWIKQAFAAAKDGRGLVLMTQANMYLENHGSPQSKATYLRMIPGTKGPEQKQPSAYDDYITALVQELEEYNKPVAFLHGDTHRYRIDHALFSSKTGRRFENFIRVETYGSPDVHWVKVTVDPADRQLFRFEAQIVPENVGNRVAK